MGGEDPAPPVKNTFPTSSLYRPQSLHWMARPAVTFPPSEHHRPSTGTKLYCLVTEAGCVHERLARGRTRRRSGWESTPRPLHRQFGAPTTTEPSGVARLEGARVQGFRKGPSSPHRVRLPPPRRPQQWARVHCTPCTPYRYTTDRVTCCFENSDANDDDDDDVFFLFVFLCVTVFRCLYERHAVRNRWTLSPFRLWNQRPRLLQSHMPPPVGHSCLRRRRPLYRCPDRPPSYCQSPTCLVNHSRLWRCEHRRTQNFTMEGFTLWGPGQRA